ncbi:sensor histidine kinase [Thaumasiovibrio subtropicus]|uniref:sensor histidine kinase n=1 Tax=Thaumasiovibrio subtropicus TaxID=1891207 RepID=UPI000B363A9D|nr:HAMP domain-containing sensor histidine kinase [Thaumasiovibrio subtropicus]
MIRKHLRNWYRTSIRHQVFTVIACLTTATSIAIITIAWAATELAADAFINQRFMTQVEQLTKQALINEAWPDLPSHLQRYDLSDTQVPEYLRGLHVGLTELETLDRHVFITESNASYPQQYWVYQPDRDPAIVPYGESVRIPVLSMALLVGVLGLITAYVLSRHITRPVLALQAMIANASIDTPPQDLQRQDELGDLNRTYIDNFQRLAQFIEREKQFTRYASHELRTPVNVIRGATDLLKIQHTDPKSQKLVARFERAHTDMTQLITTFLLLGREQQPQNNLFLKRAIEQQLDDLHHLLTQRSITVTAELRSNIQLPEHFTQVLLHNLLRNALSYALSRVEIQLSGNRLFIVNDIHPQQNSGFGHGLTIIDSICQSANWQCHTRIRKQTFYSLVYF